MKRAAAELAATGDKGAAVLERASAVRDTLEEDADTGDNPASSKIAKKAAQKFSSHYSLAHPEKYEQDIKCFGLFANERIPGAPPGGWCKLGDDGKVPPYALPKFDNDVLVEFASWLLQEDNKYKKGSLENLRSALNHYYISAKFRAPWQGSAFRRAMKAYIAARLEQAIENGEDDALGLRSPVPEDVYAWMMKEAEGMMDGDPDKTAYTLILIGWLFCLRASSTSFVACDIRFARNELGEIVTLIVDSTVLKMDGKGPSLYKQRRCPAPDSDLGPEHTRARLFVLIESMLEHGDVTQSGEPDTTSKIFTAWLQDMVPDDISNLPKGHVLKSHSIRKSAASALKALGCSPENVIMPWGRWKTWASCKLYITEGYIVTRFSGAMFDWMLPLGARDSYGHVKVVK